jgi:hypothetical protein
MTGATRAASPAGTGEDGRAVMAGPWEVPNCECTAAHIERHVLEYLRRLSPEDAELHAHLLREQAARRRRRLTIAEAREYMAAATPLPGHVFGPFGRVRRASTVLVAYEKWAPDRIVDALTACAREIGRVDLATYAVTLGIEDGLWLLSTADDSPLWDWCEELRRDAVAEVQRGRDRAVAA